MLLDIRLTRPLGWASPSLSSVGGYEELLPFSFIQLDCCLMFSYLKRCFLIVVQDSINQLIFKSTTCENVADLEHIS